MRKTIHDLKSTQRLEQEAVEEWQSISLAKNELAMDIYDAQSTETKQAIDLIVKTLRTYATGDIHVELPGGETVSVSADPEHLTYNLMYLAVEIAKDLGVVGIQLAEFTFPTNLCFSCGATVKRKGRK